MWYCIGKYVNFIINEDVKSDYYLFIRSDLECTGNWILNKLPRVGIFCDIEPNCLMTGSGGIGDRYFIVHRELLPLLAIPYNIFANNASASFDDFEIERLSDTHLINDQIPSLLITNTYGIKFAHEVELSTHLIEFKKKLAQRIERFKNLTNLSNNKVKFIRIELYKITPNYFNTITKLLNQLEKYSNNFELVLILNYDFDIDSIYSNNKVRIFQFEEFSSDWKMDKLDWEKIFI